MSLKAFHIVFITLSAFLSAGLIVWGATGHAASHNATDLMLVVVGAVGVAILLPYFRWFRQKMKRLLPCAVCFGDPTSLLTRGAQSGVLFLGLVVVALLATILAVALIWAKRGRSEEKGT